MAAATNPQADPDPTTQIAWPGSKKTQGADDSAVAANSHRAAAAQSSQRPAAAEAPKRPEGGKAMLTTRDFIFLSISMLGAQITWSVELGSVSAPLTRPSSKLTTLLADTGRLSWLAWVCPKQPPVSSGWPAPSVASSLNLSSVCPCAIPQCEELNSFRCYL
jgi:hypothetical protein